MIIIIIQLSINITIPGRHGWCSLCKKFTGPPSEIFCSRARRTQQTPAAPAHCRGAFVVLPGITVAGGGVAAKRATLGRLAHVAGAGRPGRRFVVFGGQARAQALEHAGSYSVGCGGRSGRFSHALVGHRRQGDLQGRFSHTSGVDAWWWGNIKAAGDVSCASMKVAPGGGVGKLAWTAVEPN